MVKIKIDMELLAKQIEFCDEFASIYAESQVKELKEKVDQLTVRQVKILMEKLGYSQIEPGCVVMTPKLLKR